MSFAIRARRPVAIGVSLLLAAGALSMSAPLAASAASNSSQASSIQSGLNALRAKAGLPKFVNNKYVQRYVQRYTEVYAKSGAAAANSDTKYSLPAGFTASTGPGTTLTNYSDSAAVKAAISRGKAAATSKTSGAATYSYASVGYYKKNSYTKVAFIIALQYTTPPNDLLTQSTPKISGSAKLGATLTAKTSTSPSTNVTLTYEWKAGGEVVGGNKSKLKITDPAYIGQKISVTVTATRSGYDPVTKISSKTSGLKKGDFSKKTPSVSGTRKIGKTLAVKTPSWGGVGTTYTYQWVRNGKSIKNATGMTYKQAYADKNKKINVKVKAVAPGYNSATKTSSSTSKTKK